MTEEELREIEEHLNVPCSTSLEVTFRIDMEKLLVGIRRLKKLIPIGILVTKGYY